MLGTQLALLFLMEDALHFYANDDEVNDGKIGNQDDRREGRKLA